MVHEGGKFCQTILICRARCSGHFPILDFYERQIFGISRAFYHFLAFCTVLREFSIFFKKFCILIVEVVELNVQSDHVHLIMLAPPKVAISDVMGRLNVLICLFAGRLPGMRTHSDRASIPPCATLKAIRYLRISVEPGRLIHVVWPWPTV